MDLVGQFSLATDYRQLPSYAAVMERIGWDVIPVGGSYLFSRRVGPVAFAKLQHPSTIDVEKLVFFMHKLHIVQCFVEPALCVYESERAGLIAHGFSPTVNHHAYTKTLVCDIAGGMNEVLALFSKTTSYQMRKSQKNKVRYEIVPFGNLKPEQKKEILTLHAQWSAEKNVLGYDDVFLHALWQEMTQEGKMILAWEEQELVGALFLLTHHNVGMYFYQFSSLRARQSLYVPSGLAYQAICEAKRVGCTIFDLCSAYDERYPTENVKWRGFSVYKEHFHPTPVYYPGAFVRTNVPFL